MQDRAKLAHRSEQVGHANGTHCIPLGNHGVWFSYYRRRDDGWRRSLEAGPSSACSCTIELSLGQRVACRWCFHLEEAFWARSYAPPPRAEVPNAALGSMGLTPCSIRGKAMPISPGVHVYLSSANCGGLRRYLVPFLGVFFLGLDGCWT